MLATVGSDGEGRMQVNVTHDDIRAVYLLSSLTGNDEEIAAMREHFAKMFRHLDDLSRVPVEGVEPSFLLPHCEMPLRTDQPSVSAEAKAIQSTFVECAEGFLVVPRVVTRGEGGGSEDGEENP